MREVDYEKLYILGDTHFWFVGRREIIKGFIDKLIISKENRILDVGCGTGNIIKLLENYGVVYGIDLSKTALSFCKKQELNLICQGAVMNLPFKDAQFDLITCFDVLSHVSIIDDCLALKEILRVLKAEGHLLFMDVACNFMKSQHDEVFETRERYYKKKVKLMFKEAGLSLIKISYVNFFLFLPLFFVRIFKKLCNNSEIDLQSDFRPVHPLINYLAIYILKIEARLLQRMNFPIGSTIICITKKCTEKM